MTNPINNPVAGPVCKNMIKELEAAGWTVTGPAERDIEIERLRAKLARVEAERDKQYEALKSVRDDNLALAGRWKDRAEAAEARLAEAEKVIAPFANAAPQIPSTKSGPVWGYGDFTVSYEQFRAAAKWMEKGDE